MNEPQDNPYLTRVPLDRVRTDARAGVALAKEAWRQRDPETAGELGSILRPGEEAQARRQRIIEAAGAYQKGKTRRAANGT